MLFRTPLVHCHRPMQGVLSGSSVEHTRVMLCIAVRLGGRWSGGGWIPGTADTEPPDHGRNKNQIHPGHSSSPSRCDPRSHRLQDIQLISLISDSGYLYGFLFDQYPAGTSFRQSELLKATSAEGGVGASGIRNRPGPVPHGVVRDVRSQRTSRGWPEEVQEVSKRGTRREAYILEQYIPPVAYPRPLGRHPTCRTSPGRRSARSSRSLAPSISSESLSTISWVSFDACHHKAKA